MRKIERFARLNQRKANVTIIRVVTRDPREPRIEDEKEKWRETVTRDCSK